MGAIDISQTQDADLSWSPDKNPPVLYRWALGRVVAYVRNNETNFSQTDMAEKITALRTVRSETDSAYKAKPIQQRGYAKVEYGTTPNFDLFLEAATVLDKDIFSLVGIARILMLQAQAEAYGAGKKPSKEKLEQIADSYLGSAFIRA